MDTWKVGNGRGAPTISPRVPGDRPGARARGAADAAHTRRRRSFRLRAGLVAVALGSVAPWAGCASGGAAGGDGGSAHVLDGGEATERADWADAGCVPKGGIPPEARRRCRAIERCFGELTARPDLATCVADEDCTLAGGSGTCDCAPTLSGGGGLAVNRTVAPALDRLLSLYERACPRDRQMNCCDCGGAEVFRCVQGSCTAEAVACGWSPAWPERDAGDGGPGPSDDGGVARPDAGPVDAGDAGRVDGGDAGAP